jgi:peptidoglycan/LPS O-acetylase OafA/YrhL
MAVVTLPLTKAARPLIHEGRFYRPDIDGLRALAIISVVAFHARLSFFGGGFVGVDIFFVISGYLIGALVYRDVRESRFSIGHFYERRVKRILPALLTVLVVCNLIAFLLLSPLELRRYCEESFSAVFSVSNIYYWLRSNYFSPATAYKPLLMTWSLGIEEQFYLLFPITLFLLHWLAKRRLFHTILAFSALSFVWCVVCTNLYPSAAFYLLPTRAWELGLGVLIAILEVDRGAPARLSPTTANILASLGLAVIVLSVLVYTETTRFPGVAAALPTAGTACLILSPSSFVNRRFLANRAMTFIGLISYSWYLWHWPLMSFARIVSGGLLSAPRAVLIAVFSLLLAVLSYYSIEQPFRRSVTPRVRLFAGYTTFALLLGIVSFVGFKQSGWPNRVPELVKVEATVHQVEKNTCLAGFEDPVPRLRAPCIVNGPGPKAALIGDSHAAALGTTLKQLAQQHGLGFDLFTKASCAPLLGVSQRLPLHPLFEASCTAFNRAALQRVRSDPSIRVVVLAGFWSAPYLDTPDSSYPAGKGVPAAANYDELRSGLVRTIAYLQSSGKRVVVTSDVPRFEIDPMSNVRNVLIKRRGDLAALLSSHIFSLDPVAEQTLIKPADKMTDAVVKMTAAEAGAEFVDLTENLCPESHCAFWHNGVLFYSDTHHVTPAGAEYALGGRDPIADAN